MSEALVDVLVAGAGLAGLAAALGLRRRGRSSMVVERESEVGGLCRSIRKDGFTFDMTGHVLHIRSAEVRELVHAILPGAWTKVARRAEIHVDGVHVDYPFQVNLAPLPAAMKKECLLGFWNARRAGARRQREESTFEEWIVDTFGEGIARHFMLPYNRKMWGVPLGEMSAEWTSWSVPVPTLEEVVDGALGLSRKAFGYNPEFLYPTAGGIDALPRALAREAGAVVERDELLGIDLDRRVATLGSGRRLSYAHLVSSLPLPVLVGLCAGLEPELEREARALRHVSVVVVNLGVRGRCPWDAHWVYFPDPALPFYRVGFPSNFSRGVAPAGTFSMYVEISSEGGLVDRTAVAASVRRGLEQVGILRPGMELLVEDVIVIPHGYVIYDFHRRATVPRLLEVLERHGVTSTGRYGAWEYGSMETAIAQGLAAAQRVP